MLRESSGRVGANGPLDLQLRYNRRMILQLWNRIVFERLAFVLAG